MTENTITTEAEAETLPCGHTRVEHLMQRVELGHDLAERAGVEIPEGEQPRYDVLAILVYVTNGAADDNTYTAMTDITMTLMEKAFPESKNIPLDFATTVIEASENAQAREEAKQADASL